MNGVPDPAGLPSSDRDPNSKPRVIPLWRLFGATLLGLIMLSAGLAIDFVSALGDYGHLLDSPQAQGAIIGATLSPFIFACLGVGIYYTKRKERRTRGRVAFAVAAWTLVISLIVFLGHAGSKPRGPKMITQLWQDAARSVSTSETQSKDLDAATRDNFRQFILYYQQYAREAEKFQTDEMAGLYTAASFSKRSSITKTIGQLKAMAVLQQRESVTFESLLASARDRINSTDAPAERRAEYIKGFEKALREKAAIRKNAMTVETRWIESTLDLYEFVLNNFRSFSVRNNKVFVSDGRILDQFDKKLSRALEIRNGFLKVNAQLEASRKEGLSALGVSPGDMGLPQEPKK